MPSWKKVITSGSNASLNSLTVINGITGSLLGTSSYAVTASYALTSSYSQNLQISGSINNVDYIDFNTGSAIPAWKSGRVYWDNTDGALSVYNAEADISLQVGQEQWVKVYNNTGAPISNGTPVRLVGALGDNPLIVLAQSVTGSGTPISENQLIGVATHTIENNSIGYATTNGLVRGLNTSAFAEGDLLYVSSSAGQYTKTVPIAPYEIIQVGVVIKVGPGGSGIIYVDVTQPVDLADLTSVERGTYNYGDILTFVQSGSFGVWRHTNQLSSSYGLTGSLSIINGGITGSLFGTSSWAVNAVSASFLASTTNAFLQGGNSFGTTALLGTNDNQSLALETSGSTRMFISNNGNVGIGTTSPTALGGSITTLDIKGISGGGIRSGVTGGSESTFYTIAAGGYLGTISNIPLNFQTNNSVKATILANGNVGIGTTSPNAKLDVNGNAIITGSLQISSSIFQYSNNAAITSGSTANIASFPTSSYTAGFFDFVASSNGNARAGTVFTVWNGNNVEYTETSTNDIGNTSNLILSASLSAGAIRLQGTSLSGSWSVKTLARMI